MTCSFQKPEPEQPLHQRRIPAGIPSPDACILLEDTIAEYLKAPGLSDEVRMFIEENMIERRRSPIAIKDTPEYRSADGVLTHALWMRAKSTPKYEIPFQKVWYLALKGSCGA